MRVTPILLAGTCALALAATTLPARADGRGDGWRGDGGPAWHHPAPRGDWRDHRDGGWREGDRGWREGAWRGDGGDRRGYYAPPPPPPVYVEPPSLHLGFWFR